MHSLDLFLWVRCSVSPGFALTRVVIEIFAPNNDCKNAGWMLRIAPKFFCILIIGLLRRPLFYPSILWGDLSLAGSNYHFFA